MLGARRPDPAHLRRRFFEQFAGRTIIVHAGFLPRWLEELLEQPGGGGHFRVDARRAPGRPPTPVEWIVHAHLLPLGLPVPLLVRATDTDLEVRHLTRGGKPVDPAEVLGLANEIGTRHHARLVPSRRGFEVSWGLPVEDNDIDPLAAL
ncbi:MAG: hypothetical protein GWO02_12965 [Gammaproteobacteria bacterium]|nr:hypothetical protein [Gammaproteobacteria bacterium]